jgi:hypothetical protein
MGAWGYKALESDDGLDVVDVLADYVYEKPASDTALSLSDVIKVMKDKGFFHEDIDAIHFTYDFSAMALAELYFSFLDSGELDFDDEDEQKSLRERVKSFTADTASFEFLLSYLTGMRDEKPDEDGNRDSVILWRESERWDEWNTHLLFLIERLEKEIERSK